MDEVHFEENASATQDGHFKNLLLFSKGVDSENWVTKYLVVRIKEPLTGDGSLTIKVKQSSYQENEFVDIPGLTLTIDSQSKRNVFSVGKQTSDYITAERIKTGEITGGIIDVSISSEEPIFE